MLSWKLMYSEEIGNTQRLGITEEFIVVCSVEDGAQGLLHARQLLHH